MGFLRSRPDPLVVKLVDMLDQHLKDNRELMLELVKVLRKDPIQYVVGESTTNTTSTLNARLFDRESRLEDSEWEPVMSSPFDGM